MGDQVEDQPSDSSDHAAAAESATEKKTSGRESILTTRSFARIREYLDEPEQTFAFPRAAIRDEKRRSYLLLGFDTEYQSIKEDYSTDDIEAGQAKYQVLSYQFYAINDDGAEWSGMAVPEPNQRLSFTDFIIYAIAKGVQLGQTVPKTIVLVGHYNRADIPAFDDRDQLFWRLNNVRNSLVSMGLPIKLRVQFGPNKQKTFDLSVYVRDTMLLAPAGNKSLASLGGLIGINKMTLADDPSDERLLKQNMLQLMLLDWDTFKEYAILDAKISAKYFELLAQKFREVSGNDFVPTALSNIGMKLLIKEWSERDPVVDKYAMVGRERTSEQIYDERIGEFRRDTRTPYLEEISWFNDFASECYHGGRNEQFWFGPSYEAEWSDYDLTSAYPTAMAMIEKPRWREIRPCTDKEQLAHAQFGLACVDFEFPEHVRYPTLPVRTQNGIIFPLSGRSYCAAPEIELALALGCQMTVRFGVVVPTDPDEKVFFPFIKQTIKNRTDAPTDIEKAFWKEITNSCYGKTAQGLRDKRVYSLRLKRTERIEPSEISNPFYAAFITSYVRATVGEIINKIPDNRMIFSVTTDGFITDATDAEIAAAKTGLIAQRFSQSRLALTGDGEVLAEKHAVKQLLGWRTRGQATITPGTEGKISERYVLARAGIKPPVWATELDEQNDFILESFFDRAAGMTFSFETHTTVREMLLYDADLVSKKAEKRISMEYDFKRQPFAVEDVETMLPSLGNRQFTHIAMSTRPWKSAETFRSVRKFWDDYWSKQRLPIKDVGQYREIAELYDMLEAVGSKKRKRFLRGGAGLAPFKRLQRDLCRAFKSGQAGLAKYGYMKSREFAEELNGAGLSAAGVITTDRDVDRGKKDLFEPNCSPRLPETERILENLKDRLPEFAPELILTEPDPAGGTLGRALGQACQFVEKLKAKPL